MYKLFGVTLFVFCVISANAANLQDTLKYAEQGDVDAQYNLGSMFNNGFVDEQYILGIKYKNAKRIPQDYQQAAKWFRKAAKQGHILAQVSLGDMYSNGRGLPKDDRQAAKMLIKYLQKMQKTYAIELNITPIFEDNNEVFQDPKEIAKLIKGTPIYIDGSASTLYNVGVLYEGIQEYNHATKLYRDAIYKAKIEALRVSAYFSSMYAYTAYPSLNAKKKQWFNILN